MSGKYNVQLKHNLLEIDFFLLQELLPCVCSQDKQKET